MPWMTPYLLKRIQDERWERRAEIWRLTHQVQGNRLGCLSRQVRRLQHQLGQQLVELGQQLQRHDPYESDLLRP